MKEKILSIELENLVRKGKIDEKTIEKILDERLKQIMEEMKDEGQT